MTAYTYDCTLADQVGLSSQHTHGNGKPTRKKCQYCGGALIVYAGLWGAFTWTAANRYPAKDAKRTFSTYTNARKWADQHDLVVRWIPDPRPGGAGASRSRRQPPITNSS